MKLPSLVEKELEGCGLPWRLEHGGRHLKVVVGERMVGVLPRSGKMLAQEADKRAVLNLRAQVRRAVAELKGELG